MNKYSPLARIAPEFDKFQDRYLTADGQNRARVSLTKAETLWFNTGTLCNIECVNCYIESSPQNDRLAYLVLEDVSGYLSQIKSRNWPVREIGFTGGEPFMNPAMIDLVEAALSQSYQVLILTNAMRPMMRSRVQEGLKRLNQTYPGQMCLRVSLDHYTARLNDEIRGTGNFEITLAGMRWLRDAGLTMTVAGRTIWGETEAETRAGFAAVYRQNSFDIDPENPAQTVLFPEMDERVDVPEITTACWDILQKSPRDVMCASSRMVVKRRGADHPVVLACTLLPYDSEFEMGKTLQDAEADVYLKHRHCAKFCVLGGASCSG
ncbi:MAG: radical SAM protein [Alphaproteobacteria bacterium]|nr:radical SAM protein [Alphaproteobacteria bacterium]